MNIEIIKNKINEANIKKAYILATFDNMVQIGIYEDKEIHFYHEADFSLCSQIRIFNKELELRLVKIENETYSKVIRDEDYKDKLDDEFMFVSGNKIIDEQDNRFTVIEQTQRKIAIPFKITDNELGKGIRLVVRNYCNIDENSQVIIAESRLVGFSFDEKEVV